jgi:hypothetical protein
LVARLVRIEKVRGSIPLSSTDQPAAEPSPQNIFSARDIRLLPEGSSRDCRDFVKAKRVNPPDWVSLVHLAFSWTLDSSQVLLYRAGTAEEATGGHEGYVAGRQVDGHLTDIWTDVRVHLDGRYAAYVPRCECGWTGPLFSATPSGYAACEQLWRDKHLESFLRAREPRRSRAAAAWTPKVIHGDAAHEPPLVRRPAGSP